MLKQKSLVLKITNDMFIKALPASKNGKRWGPPTHPYTRGTTQRKIFNNYIFTYFHFN